MAMTDPGPPAVRWPDLAAIDPGHVLLAYNPYADDLILAFGGIVRPAINDPLDDTPDDYVDLRLDPETDYVLGIEIHAMRTLAVKRHPTWQAVLDAAPTKPGARRAKPSAHPAIAALIADVANLVARRTLPG